jgi:hypothetical protein
MKHWFTRLLLCFGIAGAVPALAQQPLAVVAPPATPRSLQFVLNKGQYDARARYAAELPGGRLFLENKGFSYALVAGLPGHTSPQGTSPAGPLRGHALRVSFEGATAQPTLRGAEPTGETRNYFRGNDPARWARRVPGFGQVHYGEVWPGIALKFYENASQQLEYDFQLAPQADPTRVVLRYDGADGLRLDGEGRLHIATSVGAITELAPRAWQTDAAGRRQSVACRYVLATNNVSFRLGKYDKSRPLTIDPTVIFSSFTNSVADNWGFTATYDQQGNLYSGGIVFGVGFPTTVGAFSTSFNGTLDMFGFAFDCDIALIKYNPNVTGPAARVWATYLGGSSSEFPHSIVTNAQGDLVLLGTTSSANFPTTTGAYDRSFGGGPTISPYSYPPFNFGPPYDLPNGSDLVVTRLSALGDSLLGSTFLGGSDNDGLLDATDPAPRLCHNYGDYFRGDILLDATGNVYIASTTNSTDFPTASGFGSSYRGGRTDAVVASLSPTLSTLRWSNLLGGAGADAAYSVQLDRTGSVYVAGGTTSPDFPVTAAAYQPAPAGDVDGFVARIAPNGQTLQQATYLGTSAYDQAYFLQLDTQGEVYLLGQTLGVVPISPGRYGVAGSKQYIQKLSARLDSLRFSTVVGSGRATIDFSPTAFLVDECDRVYLSGWGGGENRNARFGFTNGHVAGLPISPNAVQATTDSADFYLAQYGPEMSRLQYATYLGNNGGEGDHVDGGTCRFDPRGFIYHAVCSCGTLGSGFPIPPGANTYSATKANFNCNNAAFKMNFETEFILTGVDSLICATAVPRRLGGSPTGGTWTGPGVTGSLASGFFFTPTPALIGTQVLTYSITGASICGNSAPLRLRVVAPPTASFAALPAGPICLGRAAADSIALSGSPAGGTFSGPGVVRNQFFPSQAGAGQHTLTYTYTEPTLTCVGTATRTVAVLDSIVVRLPPDTTICITGPAVALPAQPAGGTWAGPGVTGSAGAGFTFNPAALTGSQMLTYTAPGAGPCGGVASRRIMVAPLPVVRIAAPPLGTTYCPGAALVALAASPVGGTFSGPGVNGGSFDPAVAGVGQHVISYDYPATAFSCPATATITLTVLPVVTVALRTDTTICVASQPLPLIATPAGGTWAGAGVSGGGATGFFFTPTSSLLGSQTLTYTALGANSCGGTATQRVMVVPVPAASIGALPVTCASSASLPLSATPAGGIFSGPGVIGNSFDPALAGAGQHVVSYVYQTPGLDCPAVATTTVSVVAPTTVQVPADTVVCGGPAVRVPLRATPAGGVWSGSGVSGSPATGYVLTLAANSSGTVNLAYTYAFGVCSTTATQQVQVLPQPLFLATWEPATTCPDNRTAPLQLLFQASSTLNNSTTSIVSWDFGDGSQSTGTSTEHTYAQAGTYQPRATLTYGGPAGCQLQQNLPLVEVKIPLIPNIITPNHDGDNDTFKPVFACAPHLRIFSRWGRLVYENTAYANDWGAAGEAAGLYYYRLEVPGSPAVNGWLEVVK